VIVRLDLGSILMNEEQLRYVRQPIREASTNKSAPRRKRLEQPEHFQDDNDDDDNSDDVENVSVHTCSVTAQHARDQQFR
jgi:hypothetical protein